MDTKAAGDFLGLRSVSCNDIAEVQNNSEGEKSMEKSDDPMIASTRSISNGIGASKPGVIIARSAEFVAGNPSKDGTKGSFRPWSSLCTIPQNSVSVIANETHPFSGLLTSQLQCTNCKWKVSIFFPFAYFYVLEVLIQSPINRKI